LYDGSLLIFVNQISFLAWFSGTVPYNISIFLRRNRRPEFSRITKSQMQIILPYRPAGWGSGQKIPARPAAAEQACRRGRAGQTERFEDMKATGIVRRIDDLGRVVIPKEIRRTMRIREGDPSLMTLANWQKFCFGMLDLAKRQGWK